MTFFYDLNKKLAGIASKPETKQLNENAVAEAGYSAKAARAGKDIGKPGKNFEKIAKSAGERYGSRERGEKVAGAVLAKLRAKEDVEEGIEDRLKDLDPKNPVNIPAYQRKAASGDKPVMPRSASAKTPAIKQKPMSEEDMEEGNRFTYNLKKARDAGKTQADLDGDGNMEPVREAAKPDYIDLDKDGNRRESMKKAAADKRRGQHEEELEEGWDDMMKDVARRGGEMKRGEKIKGHKGEIEKTATGIRHTRSYDPKTGETDTGDDDKPAGEKRGRGRPKKTDRAPERVTAKAYKHKGGRKMSTEEIEEAIAALEEAGYSVEERKLTKPEMKKREEVVKSMKKNKGDFEKRYGERGEEVMYATATKMAKKKAEDVEENTVAGNVAPSAAAPKKSKAGFTFGKGIYDSMNRELENMISESMNVSVNMSMDKHGEPRKNITVSAEGEAAEQLAQLLNLAGIAGKVSDKEDHSDCGCGTSPCSCEQMVDENATDWPTNTAVIGDDDPQLRRFAGGLNRPKSSGQTTVPVVSRDPSRGAEGPEEMHKKLGEANDLGMNLYREYKNYKAK